MACVPPYKFAHIVYRTRRYEEMLTWYQTVFEAKIQHQNPALAFLTYDDEHHRFAFANLDVLRPDVSGADKEGIVGIDHVAYTYAPLEDLLENYAELKAKGIGPYWCVHHGITAFMYYADPDGNQMEFQIEAFGSTDEANEFMRGAGFMSNPIGVEFDPDEWLAQIRAGRPASEFLTRTVHEPVSPVRDAMTG